MNMRCVGYFTDRDQATPAFDPGLAVPCPVCGDGLEYGENERPVMTISVMFPGGTRSYFYRAHKDCYTGLQKCCQKSLDDSVVDMIASMA